MSSLHRPRLQQGGVQSKINMYGGALFLQNATHNEKVQVQNYWMNKNEKTLFCSGQSRKFSGSQRNPLTTRRSQKIQRNKHSKLQSDTAESGCFCKTPKILIRITPPKHLALPPAPVTRPESVLIFLQNLFCPTSLSTEQQGMQAQGLLGLCKYSLEREG